MNIRSAKFVKSAVKPEHYPDSKLPEVAFAGRSNVGKSSLINRLLNRKKLVRTSRTPGCTQTINFFEINKEIMFVDLPGYGYAKVSKEARKKWGPMVEAYLTRRETLKLVVVILDIRRTPSPDDLNLVSWLVSRKIPYLVVLTKADKLKRHKQKQQKTLIAATLGIDEEDISLFSAKTGQGKEELWEKLLSYCSVLDFPTRLQTIDHFTE